MNNIKRYNNFNTLLDNISNKLQLYSTILSDYLIYLSKYVDTYRSLSDNDLKLYYLLLLNTHKDNIADMIISLKGVDKLNLIKEIDDLFFKLFNYNNKIEYRNNACYKS